MRKPVLLLATLFLVASGGLIKGEIKTPENAPIEITSTGETTYEKIFMPITHSTIPTHTT